MRPTRRRNERGQMLVIIALMSIVIFGAAALAIDGSIQTHNRRNLQNWTDGAALAGARDLPSDPTTGVKDALQVVLQNSPWSSVSSWATSAPTGSCTSSSCVVTSYAGPAGFTNYTVSVSSPPANPQNAAYSTTNYIEVEVREVVNNTLGGVIHSNSSTNGGHSIGWNAGSGQVFGFALYSKTAISMGNQSEFVFGDVYVGQSIQNQSSGFAGFCAAYQSGSSTLGGHIIMGPPQYPTAPSGTSTYQWNQGHGANVYNRDAAGCVDGTGTPNFPDAIDQQAALGCPSSISGVSGFGGTYDSSYTQGCISNQPIGPPTLAPPTTTSATQITTCTDPTLTAGIYILTMANCGASGLQINTSTDWYCVTIYDQDGVNITIGHGGGTNVNETPWESPFTTAGTGNGSGANCPGYPPSSTNDDRYSIYAPAGTTPTITIQKNSTTVNLVGTLYAPDGTVSVASNAFIHVAGQAIVNSWNVQSGNHPNPDVTYNPGANAAEPTGLHLVE